MFTLDASWTAIVPSPRLVLAPLAVPDAVPPDAISKGVIPVIAPPVIETALVLCVEKDPSPKLVLASLTFNAPVPPELIGSAVVN